MSRIPSEVAAILLVVAGTVGAQPPAKLPRIGILTPTAPPPPASPQVEYLLRTLLVQRADQVIA